MLHLHKRFIEEGIVNNLIDFSVGAVMSPSALSRMAKNPKQIKNYLKIIAGRVPKKYNIPVATRAGFATGLAATVGLPAYAAHNTYKYTKDKFKKKETTLDKIEELKNKD
jgi:hypothetical protein